MAFVMKHDDDKIDAKIRTMRKGDALPVKELADLAGPNGNLRTLEKRLRAVHERGAHVKDAAGRRSNTRAVGDMVFGAAYKLRKGLPPKVASANGSKGGAKPKVRDMSKDEAEKHWFSLKHKTNAEALAHMTGWTLSAANRAWPGGSGRPRKGARPKKQQ